MSKLLKIFKDWALIISMVVGAAAYLVYHAIPSVHHAGPALLKIVSHLQPAMLFCMLFLAFTKVEPRQMHLRRWMLPLLLVQCVSFVALGALVYLFPESSFRIPLEAAMLCMICPTATACSVITGKLGGSMADVVTYTVVINLAVAIVVPLVVPVIYPVEGLTFWSAFLRIISKVFPLLIMPCIAAWTVRYLLPSVHDWLLSRTEWAFWLWVVSLSLAILMSVRSIVRSTEGIAILADIAVASLVCCILQFSLGHLFGRLYTARRPSSVQISAGQALGQKNTVFAIWMGYTFMDPVTSVAGGFYSVWHNVYNSLQLRKKNHEV